MFRKLILLAVAPAALAAQQTAAIPAGTFQPISLADAIKLAKENNVQSVMGANAIRTASNSVRTTKAQLYPNLSLAAGQSKSAGDRIGQSGTLVPYASVWQYNTGVTAQATLYDGGKTFADIRARKADVETSEASQVNTLSTIVYNVKLNYNAVLSANEAEAAARAQLDLAQQNLDVTVAKVNAGAANVADSLNSVVNVGNAQLAILSAQQSLRAASAALTRLVATPYLVTAQAADTADLRMAAFDSASIMAMAVDGPSVKQLQSQLASNEASIRSAKSGYLPIISANLNFTGNGTSNAYGFGDSPYPYQRALSLSASYPIFNRFQRETNIQAAQISVENTQSQLKDTKLGNIQTVITQIGLLRNAEEQIRVQVTSVRASEEALRVNQQRYALGAGTLVDLLTSQSQLIASRAGLINARLSYRNARAQIEQVIGRDLQ